MSSLLLPQTEYKNGYDSAVKILVLGDSGVGKTCLTLRFCENNFVSQYLTTIGIDFKMKTIELQNKRIKLQIWDTSCQERFASITKSYYASAMGIVFMYSCNDRDSFTNVVNWIAQAKKLMSDKACVFLVATKSDVDDRTVSYDEGQELADCYGMEFFETSARDGTNVRTLFYCIAAEILKNSSIENNKLNPIESTRCNQPRIKKRSSAIFPDWLSKFCCSG